MHLLDRIQNAIFGAGGAAIDHARAGLSQARRSDAPRTILRVAQKEIGGVFSSLAAIIFIGVFLAAALFIFFWVERFFARNVADLRPLFEWMPVLLIFLVSALTMRMWSEERRSGAMEFLLTSSARPWRLVLGKFLACLALVAVALTLTLPLAFTVAALGPLDWGPVFGGYLATLCLASAYISIGLFVSARTDSQIVALIVTAMICGAFYLIGSDALTSFVGTDAAAALRALGAGSRFESITRGVIDLRDLYYYVSIFGVFMVLNLYALESGRWAGDGRSAEHLGWRVGAGLVIANLVAGNLWLSQIASARADLTEGAIYSIAPATRDYLRRLEEPLLIRGYFSAETHPKLAPLAPRLQDLIKEYEIAGGGRVRAEIVDPIDAPDIEEEAGRRYGLRPVPFQTDSKYQTSVTSSYFDIVLQYGDDFETIGYADLIEVKATGASGDLDVDLRNPEYEITRALRQLQGRYRASGDLFEAVETPVTLTAYVSADAQLPEPLPEFKRALEELIAEYRLAAPDKFTGGVVDPAAEGGAGVQLLTERYGLRPLTVGLLDAQTFWFHLILNAGDKLLQLPLPSDLTKEGLKRAIDGEIKRLAPGALRRITLVTPPAIPPNLAALGAPQSGPQFATLQRQLEENAEVALDDLTSGRAPDATDALVVAAPQRLTETQVFAIDQFLMRGGSVIVAASPFLPQLQTSLAVAPVDTGLEAWFAHHGLSIDAELVLDPRNTAFPVPTPRMVGGFQVQEIRMLPYPHFVNIGEEGLAGGAAPSAGLGQLTMTWASPITLDAAKTENLAVTPIARSSLGSWASASTAVLPDYTSFPEYGYAAAPTRERQLLAVALEGGFTSFFAGRSSPLLSADEDAQTDDAAVSDADPEPIDAVAAPQIGGVIDRSPQSARLVLMSSASFLSDDALGLIANVERADYLTSVRLVENTIDWALEDRALLGLRARPGRFSRALEPMSESARTFWEAANYAMALLGLAGVAFARRNLVRSGARRRLAALHAAMRPAAR